MRLNIAKQIKKNKGLRGVQQNLLSIDRETKAIITYLCEQSNSLYNCGTYWARQVFVKTTRLVSKFEVIYECGKNVHAFIFAFNSFLTFSWNY